MALVLAAALCISTFAQTGQQDAFTAIPESEAGRYHIDFARHFFASPEAEKTDRANFYATIKQLESLKRHVGSSADRLERALRLHDRVQVELRRHYAYLHLRNAVNTTDEASLAEASALYADVSAPTAFLRQELMQIDNRGLARMVAHKPSLKSHLTGAEFLQDVLARPGRFRSPLYCANEERLYCTA